jgi:hypothetical protein
MGRSCPFVWGGKLNDEKNTKIINDMALDGPVQYLTCNNQPKAYGHDGGGME